MEANDNAASVSYFSLHCSLKLKITRHLALMRTRLVIRTAPFIGEGKAVAHGREDAADEMDNTFLF